MPLADGRSLWRLIAGSGLPERRFLADAAGRVALRDLRDGSCLYGSPKALRGRSVLIASKRQLPAALAMIALDGLAGRIVLCPPDTPAAVIAKAGVDAIVSDETGPAPGIDGVQHVAIRDQVIAGAGAPDAPATATEWLLFTSGTTGRPKLVVHTLATLIGPLEDGLGIQPDAIWSTFYDIRRYGGLQMLMRALLGGGSMVLSQSDEAVGDFLTRAGAAGVTHMSGTPSHWRRALMSAAITRLTPAYVRLSGEVADQSILNRLRLAFPRAGVAHAFASTEAGVAFDIRDGMAGFPPSALETPPRGVELRIAGGSLRIRSARAALRYADAADGPLADADGFVDTGDMLTMRDGRYHFAGRREGIINVGGQKVHPEEVEAVINQHPSVRLSRVRARPSPITGAVVVADVVLAQPGNGDDAVTGDIVDLCRRELPAHKVPTRLYVVASLGIAASGKMARGNA
jgi:acyl-coenzyme A synthetase/AMP-(fatty) acid ligase